MKEKLSQFHIMILLYMVQTEVGIFTLPRTLAETFGTNGWLGIFICAFAATLNIYLISIVYRLGKGSSIFEIMEKSINVIILYPLYFGLTLLWVAFYCVETKHYILIFQLLSFPSTPPMLFTLALDFLIFLLVIKSIYNISKAATVCFWLTIWMVVTLIAFIPDFDFTRLTPFIFKDRSTTFNGIVEVYSAFIGYEFCLLLFPYVGKESKIIRATYLSNWMVSASYLLICFVAFGFFSFEQLKRIMFPFLDLLAYLQFPIIERIETLLYSFLMLSIIITSVMYLWAAKETMKRIFHKANPTFLAFILASIGYCISFIPDVLSDTQLWLIYLGLLETSVAFLLPLLLIILLLIQKRGKTAHG